MYTLLLLAVVLVFLLEPAAASSVMDTTLPVAPMETFFTDSESIMNLNPICQCCAIPFYQCMRAIPQAPYAAAAQMFYDETQSFHPLLQDNTTAAELAPVLAYVTEGYRQPPTNENIQYINTNETMVQSETVQAHIEDTYTPGDRLDERNAPSRKPSHRRHAPRPRGYPCNYQGCDKTFDRACELNRHRKTHLDSSERPHQCNVCNEGFLYPKDLHRHSRKHMTQRSAQLTFYCQLPGCNNFEGFSRRDNLLRHQRRQHASIVAAA